MLHIEAAASIPLIDESEVAMNSIKLKCGRTVSFDNFYYRRTYGELFLGRPDQEMNQRIISKSYKRMEPLWGPRKTYVIEPLVDESDLEHPRLPPVQLAVWLSCNDPIDRNFMGSQLVVVWFRHECHDEPLFQIIRNAVESLLWDELAQDFDY